MKKIIPFFIFTSITHAGIFTPFLANRALAKGDNQKALELYQNLLDEKEVYDREETELGKATALYRLGQFEKAREAYSVALNSSDQKIREAAHQGLGNTLFQIGWKKLGNQAPYFGAEEGKKEFQKKLSEIMEQWGKEKNTDPDSESESYRKLKEIVKDWADSARHNQSALAQNSSLTNAAQNEQVARTYIKKILDALTEMEKQASQAAGEQGDPREGEGEGGDEGNQSGKNKGKGKRGGNDKNKQNSPPKDQKPDPNNKYGADKREGETKEAHALRKLKENADIQSGVQAPGERLPFRRPRQDW